MAIIKSNSALVAFDGNSFLEAHVFTFLSYVQSFKLTTQARRTDNKFLSSDVSIRKQFVKPEVVLDLSFFQTNDFHNEILFGFSKKLSLTDQVSFASNFLNYSNPYTNEFGPFNNKNAYILLSELNSDLIGTYKTGQFYNNNTTLLNNIITISLANLFLNSYSFSYRINELPVVNCSFLCSDLLISKLNYTYAGGVGYNVTGSRNNQQLLLKNKQFDDLIQKSDSSKEYLVLLMKELVFETNFSEAQVPGPNINTFLSGLIQGLDISIDFNRSEFHFFNSSSIFGSPNDVFNRNIIPPLRLKLNINGISNNFSLNSVNSFFIQDKKFSCSVLMGSSQANSNFNKLIFENLRIENFNYSININGMLEYSIECYCDVTDKVGFRILELNKFDPSLNLLFSSDDDLLLTKDSFTISGR